MAALTKNAISVTGRDRAKWTKIWDHKGYKSQMLSFVLLSFVLLFAEFFIAEFFIAEFCLRIQS